MATFLMSLFVIVMVDLMKALIGEVICNSCNTNNNCYYYY